jgi:hypothetical protein
MLRISTLENLLAFGFAAALVCLPGCDKDAPDKPAADAPDNPDMADTAEKAEPAPGTEASEVEQPAAAELAELDADGRVDVIVDAGGYHPAEVRAPAGSKVTLAFTRTSEQGCGQELVIEAMEIKRPLPLNEAVEIEVVVPASGELGFACGMNMYRGKVTPKS